MRQRSRPRTCGAPFTARRMRRWHRRRRRRSRMRRWRARMPLCQPPAGAVGLHAGCGGQMLARAARPCHGMRRWQPWRWLRSSRFCGAGRTCPVRGRTGQPAPTGRPAPTWPCRNSRRPRRRQRSRPPVRAARFVKRPRARQTLRRTKNRLPDRLRGHRRRIHRRWLRSRLQGRLRPPHPPAQPPRRRTRRPPRRRPLRLTAPVSHSTRAQQRPARSGASAVPWLAGKTLRHPAALAQQPLRTARRRLLRHLHQGQQPRQPRHRQQACPLRRPRLLRHRCSKHHLRAPCHRHNNRNQRLTPRALRRRREIRLSQRRRGRICASTARRAGASSAAARQRPGRRRSMRW